jgi:hypothetical protein
VEEEADRKKKKPYLNELDVRSPMWYRSHKGSVGLRLIKLFSILTISNPNLKAVSPNPFPGSRGSFLGAMTGAFILRESSPI